MDIIKGDIILANLEPVKGHKQGGVRPCLIIQNNIYNKYSPIVIVAAITSKKFTKEFPTNVFISKQDSGLDKNSTILLNQIRTINKKRLIKKVGTLDNFTMNRVNEAIKVCLDLE